MNLQRLPETVSLDQSISIFFTTFAGFPATIVYGGTSFVTTALAATIDPFPIVTPFKIVTNCPIHTLSSMITGTLEACFQLQLSFEKPPRLISSLLAGEIG